MITIFFAHGFEEIEGLAVLDILRRAELDVRSVGVGGREITGSHGITVTCDMTALDADTKDLEMVVLPGGMPGTLNLEKSQIVTTFIQYAVEQNLWLAAICAAPSILGHMGLLAGKRVTCFPGFETQLGEDAIFTGSFVERDSKLVTARGAGVAVDFGLELVECLLGSERAGALRASLQCR
ncbi:DJ-1 family glyoxalase III [Oscillospiraceae bacterium MB08-C2-2]|nr:DJ-1 family glyoxalase III [Oscillospiraceae bacterium MB08-C2-2]